MKLFLIMLSIVATLNAFVAINYDDAIINQVISKLF